MRKPPNCSGAVCRITSYNVCYTKLLRNVGDDFPIILSLTVDEKLKGAEMGTLTTGEAIDEDKKIEFNYDGITIDYRNNFV